jgi:hypothetical protein
MPDITNEGFFLYYKFNAVKNFAESKKFKKSIITINDRSP